MKKTIVFIGLSMLAFSCDYQKIENPAPFENTVTKGEKFHIPLPEDHTTGYMWQMSNAYDNKTLDYFGSVFHGNEKGVHFNFLASQPGKTTLNFSLIKYRDTAEVKQFIIEVK